MLKHGELARQYDGAAALLASGARVDLRDSVGLSALDLARGLSVPDFLWKGLQGQLAECNRLRQVALTQADGDDSELDESVEEAI